MNTLKGTKTEKNLMSAFAGESQARNRYTFFASVAKKEGYEQIAGIFLETADNEKEHAKRFFKLLGKVGDVEITGSFPTGIGTTIENLESAAKGEHEEWYDLYERFSKEAAEEGFAEISVVFKKVSEVEQHHEMRYRKLLENIENNTVFKKPEVVQWKCRNCGYVFTGKDAPEKCPACAHPKSYFELLADNF